MLVSVDDVVPLIAPVCDDDVVALAVCVRDDAPPPHPATRQTQTMASSHLGLIRDRRDRQDGAHHTAAKVTVPADHPRCHLAQSGYCAAVADRRCCRC